MADLVPHTRGAGAVDLDFESDGIAVIISTLILLYICSDLMHNTALLYVPCTLIQSVQFSIAPCPTIGNLMGPPNISMIGW